MVSLPHVSFADIDTFVVHFVLVACTCISAYEFIKYKINKTRRHTRQRKPPSNSGGSAETHT
jgi:hypothetical protein